MNEDMVLCWGSLESFQVISRLLEKLEEFYPDLPSEDILIAGLEELLAQNKRGQSSR